ncbi:Conserved developmentally regulated protein, partial [Globisporangium splendens]
MLARIMASAFGRVSSRDTTLSKPGFDTGGNNDIAVEDPCNSDIAATGSNNSFMETSSSNNDIADSNNILSSSSSASDDRQTHRVLSVGRANRKNEVLVSGTKDAACTVLFFPGDVQDFEAAMYVLRTSATVLRALMSSTFSEFSEYAYEHVAERLVEKFGDKSNVWVFRPSQLYQNAFSCFDNFVASRNEFGAATSYTSTGSAINHLLALMQNVRDTLYNQEVHLVGFSKGVVVLNQLITELAVCKREGFKSNNRREKLLSDISTYHNFFSKVCSIHWVDGGNGSQPGVVPLNEKALNTKLVVHVTPYQYESKDRPWIKEEIQAFIRRMWHCHMDVQLKMYYGGEPGSIHSHFQLLRDFKVQCAPQSASKLDAFSSPEHSPPHIPIESL